MDRTISGSLLCAKLSQLRDVKRPATHSFDAAEHKIDSYKLALILTTIYFIHSSLGTGTASMTRCSLI